MVQEVCDTCVVCAQFRNQCLRAPYGQPFFSFDPGHTVFADVIGPLPHGKGGAIYIHCMVDSVTCLGDAMRMRDTSIASILRAFQHWIQKNGLFIVLVTDNAVHTMCLKRWPAGVNPIEWIINLSPHIGTKVLGWWSDIIRH